MWHLLTGWLEVSPICPQCLWWLLMVEHHVHPSKQSLVNDYLAKHLCLYLILTTNPNVLVPALVYKWGTWGEESWTIRNLLKATQVIQVGKLRLKAGKSDQTSHGHHGCHSAFVLSIFLPKMYGSLSVPSTVWQYWCHHHTTRPQSFITVHIGPHAGGQSRIDTRCMPNIPFDS